MSESAGGIRLFFFFLLALLGFAHAAMAQDLTPRAYLIAPVGTNATTLTYSNLEGNLNLNGAVPITGATAKVNLALASYYHTLDFFGRSANVALGVPYGVADFKGTIVEAPRSAHRSGLLDSVVRFSVNLMGGPAMEPAEFAKWQQKTLLGISLQIVAPTGQYDPTLLINLGSNRWTFRPEIGYSQRWGHWILDGYGAVNFFTQNPEYFSRNSYFPGIRTQSENSVISFEGHLSYDFRARLWVSVDANFWRGGATSLNGVENPITNQKSSRVGITASIPFTAHQSIKISLSDGAYVRYGGNYKSISVAWQYGWLGGPKFH